MSVKVAVRLRPFNQREIDLGATLIVEIDGKKTRLAKPKLSSVRDAARENYHDFTFDYSYWSFDNARDDFVTQEQVYDDLGTDVINCAFQGYNACVFAYGQTGSGKTFTMMGSQDYPGLIPRICQALFARMKISKESARTGYKTHASYLEIYNEKVKDLLSTETLGHGLRVREHRNLGPYVENLSEHAVADYTEIQECIDRGNRRRTTAATNMNDTSSRSHAIFTITFVQAGFMNSMPSETVSKIHLVDLAGSERANSTGATVQRLKEGAHINKSLVTLGSVISTLADQSNRSDAKRVLYIPYRDSVLTWLLKDSLGGNSKTIMIALISPANCNYSETLSTLRYANRAKNIINKPTINEDPNVKLIRELRDEIFKLKSMLGSELNLAEPSSKMLEDLLKKEAQEKVLTEEWTEKWREAQIILQEQRSLGLRKAGVGVILDSEMPHLIGIHDDISTGVTLYSLKEGETLIGTEDADIPQDIVLSSNTGVLADHCQIIVCDGLATISPQANARCFLNAKLITEPTPISQGDILLLGTTNIFRFNNPAEAARLQKDPRMNRSRLDISRLSLITASRENLMSSCHDEENSFSSLFKRHKQHEDPELQQANSNILETIESGLRQFTLERIEMHEQYKKKLQELTEERQLLEKEQHNTLEILECREKEVQARKDMLLWEKKNEEFQVDIVCRQLTTLQTQLDSNKRDFFDYVAKELQALRDGGNLDELELKITDNVPLSHEFLSQIAESLVPFSSQSVVETIIRNKQNIQKLEEKISSNETGLKASRTQIAKLDQEIMQLDEIGDMHPDDCKDVKFKKMSLRLNLKPCTDSVLQTDMNSSNAFNTDTEALETCDTFHTAHSDCSFPFSSPPSTSYSKSGNKNMQPISLTGKKDNFMSDSGLGFETVRFGEILPNFEFTSTPNVESKLDTVCSNDEDGLLCVSYERLEICVVHSLQKKIALQKALIMKNLEMEVDKQLLDEEIAQLQVLQKKLVTLEREFQVNEKTTGCYGNGSCHFAACRDNDNSENDSVNSDSKIEHIYPPSATLSPDRSFPSMDVANSDVEQIISIPGFVIRGAGKQTHYEYEINISLLDRKLSILRRYSRFRELHLSMKNLYGAKVALLPFPRRELFSTKSESVAVSRRRSLEMYLRRLLAVCSKIPQSPIFNGAEGSGITKSSLAELSNFFKKGLFESGKHGTG